MSAVSTECASLRLRSWVHLGLVMGLSVSPLAISTSYAQEVERRSYAVPAGEVGAAKACPAATAWRRALLACCRVAGCSFSQ